MKKQKSTSTINQTQTPIAPAGSQEALTGLFGTINNVRGMDPYSLVAPSNTWLDTAGEKALSFGKSSREALAELDSVLGSGPASATAQSGLAGLQNWFNPYEDRVIKNALSEYDRSAAETAAAEDMLLNKSSAFAGSGGAIAKALAERERLAGRSSLDANLRHQGWNAAAGFSSQDADRTTSVNVENARLAQQHQAMQAQTILQKAGLLGDLEGREMSALTGMGGLFRDMDTEKRQAPLTLAAWEAELLKSGTPLAALLTGQHTTGTQTGTTKVNDPLGTAMDIGKTIASFAAFSDERLKDDVQTIGHDAKGRRWVSYRYKWDPDTIHTGVIAQEVAKTDPHAVSVHESGYLMVNYGELR